MTLFDIIIACILGFAVFKGFKNGLIISVISLVSLILGIYIALHFSFYVKDLLSSSVESSSSTLGIMAFVITFLIVLVALFFLGKVLTKVIDVLALGILNRLGGALFEVVKFAMIISVLLNLFHKINFNEMIVSNEKLESTYFYTPLETFSKSVFPLMEEWYDLAKEKATE